jgi:DNA-binding NtrC family response regulator
MQFSLASATLAWPNDLLSHRQARPAIPPTAKLYVWAMVAVGALASAHALVEAGALRAALRIAGQGGPIHGVLTDVIMPGMNGKQMVNQLLDTRPDLKVLYMSGYSGTTYVDRGIVDRARERLLDKPFTRDTLLRTLREVMESQPREAGGSRQEQPVCP